MTPDSLPADRKFVPVPESSEVNQSSDRPGSIQNRWALLVGINRYIDPAFAALNFCVNDVLALEKLLKQLGYIVEIGKKR
jgi:Caspase domain